MTRDIMRTYTLSAVEVRDAIFYWLANARDCPVPDTYDDATITWDNTQKACITWMVSVTDEPSCCVTSHDGAKT